MAQAEPGPLDGRLSGRRVLVVGASSGVGRSIAQHAVAEGAQVAFAARRAGKLREAVDEAGAGIVLVGDVREEADCKRFVSETVEAFGGLDLVVFTAARIPLIRFTEVDAEGWRALFETNAVGAFFVLGAAIPHLGETGLGAYVSTIGVESPYAGRGPYIVSKAALDGGIRALRVEHPHARITRIVLAPTAGTEASAQDDKELAYELMPDWIRSGRVPDRMLDVRELGGFIVDTLASALKFKGELEELAIDSGGRPVQVPVDREAVIAELAKVQGATKP